MADNYKNARKALKEYGGALLDRYNDKLKDAGISSNSSLYDTSVKTNIVFRGFETRYQIIFHIEDYYIYVEEGRRPGKFPPVDAIRNWIIRTPVIPEPYPLPNGNTVIPTQDQLAFLIGRKIAKEGIQARPFIEESLNELNDEYMQKITEAIALDTEQLIIKELEK